MQQDLIGWVKRKSNQLDSKLSTRAEFPSVLVELLFLASS